MVATLWSPIGRPKFRTQTYWWEKAERVRALLGATAGVAERQRYASSALCTWCWRLIPSACHVAVAAICRVDTIQHVSPC